ncbi:MAG: DEAD/DEAH box helicase [Nanoarchaeota archaeon]|nr:DEAD/DEAH box helicase [Nanoarchaeota archaeon]
MSGGLIVVQDFFKILHKMATFEKLGLSEEVLHVIKDKKFTEATEIQEKTIPLINEGKDLIAGSATGSGKTLAFGAGIIKKSLKGGGIQALILTPTRELAEQVAVHLEEFSYYSKLEVCSVYGGVSMEPQTKKLSYAEIVVATPGRLLDHLNRNSIDLSRVKFLVLDEADRMWDMGFKNDVAKIVNACPKNRQTLLFSATISAELADFSSKYMNSPTEISVDNYVDASKLKQVYYDVPDNGKFSLLVHLLENEDAHLVMIFCNTRRNVDFVVKNLKLQGISAQAIHGGLTQAKRNLVLKRFDDSKVNVLVCTDVAARGLDITSVTHVYNYDTTRDARDYVHRIGRTARAGKEGVAISILGSRDYDNFANVQRHNPELKIENVTTPNYKKVFVKVGGDDSRGRFGEKRSFGRGAPRRDSRGPRRDSNRSSSGSSRGPRRSNFRSGGGGGQRSHGNTSQRSSGNTSQRSSGNRSGRFGRSDSRGPRRDRPSNRNRNFR